MITVVFCEEHNTVRKMLAELFGRAGISYAFKNDPEAAGFALVQPDGGAVFDVALCHSAAPGRVSAEYFTLINADDVKACKNDRGSIVITYGLNSLATAAASSIEADGEELKFQYCLQRNIATLKGRIIEPQEFKVCIGKGGITIHDALAYVTLALIFNAPPELISF